MKLRKDSKIFLAGHNGMVGSAIYRYLKKKKYKKIIVINKKQLNLLDQKKTIRFIKFNKPDFVIIAAARVGGINANNLFKGNFIYENITIQNNLIHGSFLAGVKKLIFLGSSCVYPKFSIQPIKEDYLLSGKLEETNDAYAIAKISGIKMCEAYNNQYGVNYICLMPTNLFGPNDNYDLKTSHFFPALINKISTAKKNNLKFIELWGNGKAKRELMHVDDLADACEFFLRKKTKHSLINIGSGKEMSILDYCKYLMKKLNFDGKIKYNNKMPNGTPRKILNCDLAKKYGWKAKIKLDEGLMLTLNNLKKSKKIL